MECDAAPKMTPRLFEGASRLYVQGFSDPTSSR